MKDTKKEPDMLSRIDLPAEAAEETCKNNSLSLRSILVCFGMAVSALLAVLCILLFISTLPKDEYLPFSGVYHLSYGEIEGSKVSAAGISMPTLLELSENGWCHIALGEEIYTGRWSNDNGNISIRCWSIELKGCIENGQLFLKNVMDREIDLIFTP